MRRSTRSSLSPISRTRAGAPTRRRSAGCGASSGITRAIQRLGIEHERWGGRDKHLAIADVLTIAANAQRASLEEVAGNMLTWAESEHPEQVDAFTAEVDAFFAALPAPKAQTPDAFIAELSAALPKRWAAKAEDIWREHGARPQGSNT